MVPQANPEHAEWVLTVAAVAFDNAAVPVAEIHCLRRPWKGGPTCFQKPKFFSKSHSNPEAEKVIIRLKIVDATVSALHLAAL